MFKRILSILMAAVMLFSLGTVVSAESESLTENESSVINYIEGNEIQPLYSYTNTVSTTISISNGQATCYTKVNGYSGTTTKIQIKMTLQKKTLFWWSDQQSWSSTTNGYTATLAKTASVGSGTYRVKAEITVYSGTKSESITQYSQEVKV